MTIGTRQVLAFKGLLFNDTIDVWWYKTSRTGTGTVLLLLSIILVSFLIKPARTLLLVLFFQHLWISSDS